MRSCQSIAKGCYFTLWQMSDPSLAWKNVTLLKIIGDDVNDGSSFDLLI